VNPGYQPQTTDWRKRWRFVIFFAVGLINTGAFFVLATVLTYFFQFGTKTSAYTAYAFLVPISFFGHRRITFGSNGPVSREWIKFCVIQVTNLFVITVVTHWAEVSPLLSGWPSFAVISVFIPIMNFIVFQLWVFSKNLSS
jgi:putative flippase GtrA